MRVLGGAAGAIFTASEDEFHDVSKSFFIDAA
jgi:hypothetical protein